MTTKRRKASGSAAAGEGRKRVGTDGTRRNQTERTGAARARSGQAQEGTGAAAGRSSRTEGTGAAVTARELSLDILMEILERGGLSHVVLNQALAKYQYLDKQDRAFVTRVTEGTIEYQIQIDYVIDRYSRTKVQKMKPLIRTLLRMSVYQILYMDRVPDAAVCNEAVNLAEKRRFAGLKGFVNGTLRSIVREKEMYRPDAAVWPDDSVRYSMPQWLIGLWTEAYGEDAARAMMKAFLVRSPFTVRCNPDLASMEEIMESLRLQGVTVTRCAYAEDMLYLENIDYLEQLTAFQMGLIVAQDLSSACVAKAAGLKAGDMVLDVCGAPGGKAIHAASILRKAWTDSRNPAVSAAVPAPGHVCVRDISERKAGMIVENVRRCGYEDMITVEIRDALVFDEMMAGKADVVFADLPCSGLGVIGRKPDIKGRILPEDIEILAALQRQILSVVWQYVKPGGRLVYSTCTTAPQENIRNRDWFLANYPFEPVDISGRLGEKLRDETLKNGYIQFLPGRHPCDGFFLAVMQRR